MRESAEKYPHGEVISEKSPWKKAHSGMDFEQAADSGFGGWGEFEAEDLWLDYGSRKSIF